MGSFWALNFWHLLLVCFRLWKNYYRQICESLCCRRHPRCMFAKVYVTIQMYVSDTLQQYVADTIADAIRQYVADTIPDVGCRHHPRWSFELLVAIWFIQIIWMNYIATNNSEDHLGWCHAFIWDGVDNVHTSEMHVVDAIPRFEATNTISTGQALNACFS